MDTSSRETSLLNGQLKTHPHSFFRVPAWVVVVIATVCGLACTTSSAAGAPRPNIVLILCDDLGYADVGFNGAEDIVTPHIDSLAQRGTIFSSAYVSHPFCGPSRMGLMAGRYAHAFGAPYNLPNSGQGMERYNQHGIPTDETLLGTVLQDAGYFTGAVGKWHLGSQPQFHPNERGFDEFFGFLGGGHMYFPDRYQPIHRRQVKAGKTHFNEYITPLEHNGADVEESEYLTDALSREAATFVRQAAEKNEPFFLYLAYNAPHTPLEATADDLAKFEHIRDEKRRTYAAMVYAVDRGVGRLVDTLKSCNSFDETLIVFLSDNGGKTSAGADNTPLSQGKGSVCEGGFRVPMFFHWPNGVPSGNRYVHPVSALDFYPTFSRLAGAKLPAGKELDGKDIWDALIAGESPRKDESIFALRHWKGFHNVGVRRNQWKVTKRGPKSDWQLFDIENDISEQQDVSGQHPEVVRQLVAEARQWSQTHTHPRWFHNPSEEKSWNEVGMPVYASTFSLTTKTSPSSTVDTASAPSENQAEPAPNVQKRSPSDWTQQEYIAAEKRKWDKNGWRWNLQRVQSNFADMDKNDDGVVSRSERQAWYTKRKAELNQSPSVVAQSTASQTVATNKRNSNKPNILFIAIDDLRPELGCYGSEIAVTPNLDSIAGDGLLFNRAYCQQAICRPSRASLMTGSRPETTGLFHNYVSLRELQPDILTLPQHLIANGYETAYCGKIFHPGDTDEEKSWSRERVQWMKGIKRPQGAYALPENNQLKADNLKKMLAKYGEAARRGLAGGPAFEKADVPDHSYIDGYNTLLAIETMKEMAAGDKPFFLAMGYKLPHLNWCAPSKYWDLYDPAAIPLEDISAAPRNGAAMGLHASFELRTRSNIPKYGPIEEPLARTLKHAYLASTSYVDAQVGLMLSALEDAGLREKTIVVVWGDHGWHLGDMGVWGKATNYEIATRVPLMIWTPDMNARGAKTDALVELVDIFPTLCELADVPIPDHVEGHSFVPLLDDPTRSWKKAAFSQYPNPALREWAANPLSEGMRETWFGPLIQDVEQRIMDQHGDRWDRELFEQHLMGYTMRTDRYRLVVWRDRRHPDAEPIMVELFDHRHDPHESENIAKAQPDIVNRLIKQLDAGWESAFE